MLAEEASDGFRRVDGWTVGVDASVAVITIGAGGSIDTSRLASPIVGFIFAGQVERPRPSFCKARETNSSGETSSCSCRGGRPVALFAHESDFAIMKAFETRPVPRMDHHRIGKKIAHVLHHSELAQLIER